VRSIIARCPCQTADDAIRARVNVLIDFRPKQSAAVSQHLLPIGALVARPILGTPPSANCLGRPREREPELSQRSGLVSISATSSARQSFVDLRPRKSAKRRSTWAMTVDAASHAIEYVFLSTA
jgi:hypothetical protein